MKAVSRIGRICVQFLWCALCLTLLVNAVDGWAVTSFQTLLREKVSTSVNVISAHSGDLLGGKATH